MMTPYSQSQFRQLFYRYTPKSRRRFTEDELIMLYSVLSDFNLIPNTIEREYVENIVNYSRIYKTMHQLYYNHEAFKTASKLSIDELSKIARQNGLWILWFLLPNCTSLSCNVINIRKLIEFVYNEEKNS